MGHYLDRIYVSSPLYCNVKVISSNINTKHQAVIARDDNEVIMDRCKTSIRSTFRPRSAKQFQLLGISCNIIDWKSVYDSTCTQTAFDRFYGIVLCALNDIFPERSVSITSRDPPFMTAPIKLMLRNKNRLMRAGRVQQADALSVKIGLAIATANSTYLCSNDKCDMMDSRDMWSKVNMLSGKRKLQPNADGIDASVLNSYYSGISTDSNYVPPCTKATCREDMIWLTPMSVFRALDSLKATSAGLDGIPSWFLKSAAPFLAEPLTFLLQLSLTEMYVPTQWKTSLIVPVPKLPQPKLPSDFRPISLTPILSRVTEKMIVQRYFYPLLQQPQLAPLISDQFAFRPSGSTTAALIFLLHHVTNMLLTNDFVHIVALDFSKAFDTVKHNVLVTKMALVNVPDTVLNWFVSYLDGRGHKTKYGSIVSDAATISASVVQGSAIGPVSFLLYASDLHPMTPGNQMTKYADDTYLIVPAANSHSISDEINHVSKWAAINGLKLNAAKSQELLVTKKNHSRVSLPLPQPGINRVSEMVVLGITIRQDLAMSSHIRALVIKGNQSLYALKTLKAHGLSGPSLSTVCRATLINGILYASPAWWGFCDNNDRCMLQSIIAKAIRWNIFGMNAAEKATSLVELCATADTKLFADVLTNSAHVLHQLLPDIKCVPYNLRSRPHNRVLPKRDTVVSRNFLFRMLYKDIY